MTARSPAPRDEHDTLAIAKSGPKTAQSRGGQEDLLIPRRVGTVEAVLDAVSLIPPGSVATYGDIAELVGTGPRRVGAIMAQVGGEVAWWRVTNARGALPPHLIEEAIRRWAAEGIPIVDDGSRCRLSACRADPAALGRALDGP